MLVDGDPVPDSRWRRRQATMLVKLLALAPRQRLPQQAVMEQLWPGADPDTAGNGLHKMVHMVRHALEPQLSSGSDSRFLLRADGQLTLVGPAGVRIDAIEFEQLATSAVKDRDETACRRALALYDGDLLPSDRYADWATARRQQLRGQRLAVLQTLAELLQARGEVADAIVWLQQLLAIDDSHEPAHRQLMECFAQAGARSQALRQFEHCRATLQRELGAEPDAATRALHQRIVAGDSPAAGSAVAPTDGAIAVLPFSNLTGNPEHEFVASGAAESLIRMLSREPQLRVMAPSTVLRYRHREVDPRQVGRELGVGALLLGRLDRWGDRLAITVELIRTNDGSLLWGEHFDRDPAELMAVEVAIAAAITSRLVAATGVASSSEATRDPAAYQHYLRGRHEWNKRTGRALRLAMEHFQRAIDTDPNYALAYSGLADCHSLAGLYLAVAPHESMPRARRAAERGIELEPQLAEAHTSLAFVQFAYDWNVAQAEQAFERALRLSPSYATAYQWQHAMLTAAGRVDDQRRAIARARELDPLSPMIATEAGWGLHYARLHDEARPLLERSLATSPDFAMAWLILGLVQLADQDPEAARGTLQHCLELAEPEPVPLALGALGHAEARVGNHTASERVLARLVKLSEATPAAHYAMAMVFAGRQDRELALRALHDAFVGRTDRIAFLGVDPVFDELRQDPDFHKLIPIHPAR